MKKFLLLLLCLGFSVSAFAQSAGGGVLDAIVALLTALKSQGPYVIIAAVVQLVMKILSSSVGDVAGKYKILLVSLMSLIGAVVAGLASGEGWLQMLADGTVIAALQVFIHQLVTQISTPTTPTT